MVIPSFTIIIFINVSSFLSLHPVPCYLRYRWKDLVNWKYWCRNEGEPYRIDPTPLCRIHRRVPARLSIHIPTHEITTADKTRGMPSKGAYIYETFGKQMDKSNIFETKRAKRPKLLEELMSRDVNSTIFSCMKLGWWIFRLVERKGSIPTTGFIKRKIWDI